jgi:nucleoside-diphosphate-sugar epimerase
MRYAVVTGGLGFIGSFIARELIKENHVDKVVLVDDFGGFVSPISHTLVDQRRARLQGIEDRVIVERAQVQHFPVMHHILQRYQPAYIFHLAALPLATIQNSTSDEAMDGSVLSTSHLLESCHLIKEACGYEPERFVYASSSMVYGDFQYAPADEKHPLMPRNIYGTMKLAGEVAALGLARTFGIKAAVVRPSAVYGPTDMNRRVTQIFIENAMAGKKLIIQGEDEALDFTFVEDIAHGFVLAATREEAVGEIFNITTGHAYTLLEYAKLLQNYFPDLTYEIQPRDKSRPKRGTLSIDKARKLLGFEPAHTLKDGVDKYVTFIRHGKL